MEAAIYDREAIDEAFSAIVETITDDAESYETLTDISFGGKVERPGDYLQGEAQPPSSFAQ